MPSRTSSTPTPAELLVWLGVAAPGTARGSFRWTPHTDRWRGSFAVVGEPPVMTSVPPDVEVDFWHVAPDGWRVDLPDGPLCVADGTAAAAWGATGVETGRRLHVLTGPGTLLHPETHDRWDAPPPAGSVARDELLGRACWRWQEQDVTRWVDDETGCLLRLAVPDATHELTSFTPGVAVDPALLALPDGVVVPPAAPSGRPHQPQPTAPFSAPWWPLGTGAHPEEGDADVPELLLSLHSVQESDPQLWLGVAPAGRRARARAGLTTRRWDGDGWTFALSWSGEVDDDELERVIASIPRAWEQA